MKDIDFDELDRAVSSLMSDVPGVDSVTDEPVVDVDTPVVPIVQQPYPETPIAAVPVSSPTSELPHVIDSAPSLPPPLAARRGGRFMDVVHPSSDMKTTSSGAPSRQGMTVTPRSRPEVATETVSSLATALDSVQSYGDTQTAVAEEPPADLQPVVSVTEALPLTSPFLADAKVEKRPLGGSAINDALAAELASESEFSTTPSQPVDESLTSKSDTQLAPVAEKPVLPAELDSDLVAIESGESAETIQKQPNDEAGTPQLIAPSAGAPVSLLGAGSISQQYTEQPNSGDASHAPMYDTEEAHHALAHPAKKKSGWLWVIWILLIVLLGAGAGAAVYFFRLI